MPEMLGSASGFASTMMSRSSAIANGSTGRRSVPFSRSRASARRRALRMLERPAHGEFSKPFSAPGFGNRFRDWCNEAGLTHCSSHGLRNAGARQLAERGKSGHEIKAVTGHRTLKESTATPRRSVNGSWPTALLGGNRNKTVQPEGGVEVRWTLGRDCAGKSTLV